MRTTRTKLVAGLAASLLLISACSESTKDDDAKAEPGKTETTDKDTPETRTTRGVTDDSIKVGGSIYDLYYSDSRVGVEARLKEANDAGGINGRTIEFVGAENDNNETTKGLENVQRLVEQDEVFALLPVMSGNFGGGDYVVENNVPMFGWGTHPAFCGNDVAFGFTGCVSNPDLKTGSNALGKVLEEQLGGTDDSIAFIGEDNDSAKTGLDLLKGSVESAGFNVVLADSSLPAPPDVLGDVSPFVAKLMKSDDGGQPDVIYIIATTTGTTIAKALQDAGYDGMIVTPSFSPILLSVAGYNNTWVNTQMGMDPAVAGNEAMMKSVAAIDPDVKLNLAVSAGYWSADFFIKALEETGEDLTVETLLATLNGGFTYEVEGVVGPSTWPENHDLSVPCAALTEVADKQFVPRVPLLCGENITLD